VDRNQLGTTKYARVSFRPTFAEVEHTGQGPKNNPGPTNSPRSKNSPPNFSMNKQRKHAARKHYSTQRCLYLFRDSSPRSWKPGKQIQRIVDIRHAIRFDIDGRMGEGVQRNYQIQQLPNGRSRRFRLGRRVLRLLHPSKNNIQSPKALGEE
jgi:hypothetical protein